MNPAVASEHRRLRGELRRRGDPSQSRFLRRYLGSPLPVLGVRAPKFRELVRESRARIRGLTVLRRLALARSLWAGRTFEERELAIEILERFVPPDDPRGWRLLDGWVDSASGWGLSDSLASGPIARALVSDPRRFPAVLRWTTSPNIWRRRAATYALRAWVAAGRLGRPFRVLERLVDDPEFWVQRAVGTWLRECWKKDPARTERFLRRHARHLPPVALTVATERAPRTLRLELRRLRRPGPARAAGRA
jgi:3-methyladenine DNA glycosylase AlkD